MSLDTLNPTEQGGQHFDAAAAMKEEEALTQQIGAAREAVLGNDPSSVKTYGEESTGITEVITGPEHTTRIKLGRKGNQQYDLNYTKPTGNEVSFRAKYDSSGTPTSTINGWETTDPAIYRDTNRDHDKLIPYDPHNKEVGDRIRNVVLQRTINQSNKAAGTTKLRNV